MYTTLGMFMSGAPAVVPVTFPVVASVSFNEDTSSPYNAIMPATVNANDLLLILMTLGSSGTPNGTPSGWTQLIAGNFFGFFKWAAGTEDGLGVTVGFTASAADPGFTVVRITGADSTSTPQAAVNVENTTSTPDPPSVTPPVPWGTAGKLFVTYCGGSNPLSTINGVPIGYTLVQANAGAAVTSGIASKTTTSASAENPSNFSMATVSSLSRTFTIAVKGT